jgi:hypothetical protein
VPDIQGASFASAIWVKQLKAYYLAYILACAPGKSMCYGHMHWDRHVEVLNSNSHKIIKRKNGK